MILWTRDAERLLPLILEFSKSEFLNDRKTNKQELTTNYKKTPCVTVSKKTVPRCELQNGDVKMKQVSIWVMF